MDRPTRRLRRVAFASVALVGFALGPGDAALGQTPLTEHTLTGPERWSGPGAAEVGSVLVGRWIGEGMGGRAEESWLEAVDGQMLGTFRLSSAGLTFYEIMTLGPADDGVAMRLKHFGTDLVGWEARDEVVEFPLIRVDGGTLHFDGLTYRLDGQDSLTVFVAIRGADGSVTEARFQFRRAAGQ